MWQQQMRGSNISQEMKAPHSASARPCDETIDLTDGNDAADADIGVNEESWSLRESQGFRKRKLNEGVDIPAKQPADASTFL